MNARFLNLLFFGLLISSATYTKAQDMKVGDTDKVSQRLKGGEAKIDSGKTWTTGSMLNINFSQVYLSNWLAGGQNAVTLTGISNSFANYKKGNVLWKNSLELGYGLTKLEALSTRKSDDRIIFISNYSIGKSPKLKYSALMDFRTQFTAGYAYSINKTTSQEEVKFISDFLAPGYLVGGIGVDYIPTKYLTLFASPLTYKATIVANENLSNIGAFGVDKGKMLRSELGAFLAAKLNIDLMKNVNFKSNLNLFANYATPSLIDVSWDNLLTMKVNKWIVVTFSNQLFYDDDVKILPLGQAAPTPESPGSPKIQYKQVLNVGLSFVLK